MNDRFCRAWSHDDKTRQAHVVTPSAILPACQAIVVLDMPHCFMPQNLSTALACDSPLNPPTAPRSDRCDPAKRRAQEARPPISMLSSESGINAIVSGSSRPTRWARIPGGQRRGLVPPSELWGSICQPCAPPFAGLVIARSACAFRAHRIRTLRRLALCLPLVHQAHSR